MDRFEAMALLVASVEAGSLSAAGRRLQIPLPTISRKISDLETHLGAKLLIRSTRALSLTEAGAAYVEASKRILEEVGEAEREAAGEYQAPRGELTIAAPVTFGRLHVLPIVTEFLARSSAISVRLLLSDRNAQLADEHIDAAVRIGLLADSSMVASSLGTVRQIVVASPAFLARHGAPETPADLAGLDCIGHDFLAPASSWVFRDPDKARPITAKVRLRLSVTTADAALDAAVGGFGLARLVSYQAAEALARGLLGRVLQRYEAGSVPVSLLHAGHRVLPLKTRSFLDFAVPRLRDALRQVDHAAASPS